MKHRNDPESGSRPWMREEEKRIAKWLEKLRFRRTLFGVNERDVWKKLAELDEMYQQLLRAERVRYDTLLEQQKKTVSSPDADGEVGD